MKEHDFGLCAELLPMHELNGLQVRIAESKDPSKKGLSGRLLWETKKTFEIETKNGMKKVEKKGNIFEFEIAGKKARISGELIEFRPEDRIKALAKKMKAMV
ncbi:MAG: ribonuclease P protein subunit [Candidatus Diapherotrites archaeon]|nr:ribonuclease P protein subunit [Candidatus Diapherotrites archaeon]